MVLDGDLDMVVVLSHAGDRMPFDDNCTRILRHVEERHVEFASGRGGSEGNSIATGHLEAHLAARR